MLRDALFLVRADLRLLLRGRETLLWAFVMPILFFYFIGTITGGSAMGGGAPHVIVIVPTDAGFLADQVVRRLKERGYEVERAGRPEDARGGGLRLTIPAGFTSHVLAQEPVVVKLDPTCAGLQGDYDRVRVARAVYTVLADLIALGVRGVEATPKSFDEFAARARNLTLSVESAGARKEIPTGFQQAVPGTMVFLTLMVLFTSGGATLQIERDQGILRRLASSPMSRGAVVLGKWGARLALGVVQIAVAMLAGTILFGIRWGPHLGAVVLVLLAFAALGAALGMLLGNFGRSTSQVIAVGTIAVNLMAALGGCWWPIEITPDWCQALARFLPTGLTMDALHQLMSFGAPPSAILMHVTVLTLAALAAGWLVARSFQFQ
ncbi:MAG TPA: ABC transporter permease [Isosphaeraceae bacterium]|nr:ABC transporter permease [Isosphaeraceae bacterium]